MRLCISKISQCLATLGLSAMISGSLYATQPTAQWLSFDSGASPVARPLDALMWAPDAVSSSPRVESTLWQSGATAHWKVKEKTGADVPQTGGFWSTLGFDMPEQLFRQVRGVSLRIKSEYNGVISLEFYGGFNKTRGFYGLQRLGRLQKDVHKGEQEITFMYTEAGVPQDRLGAVGGVKIVSHSVPADFLIQSVDLIFTDKEAAQRLDEVISSNRSEGLATMQKWLSERGIELPQVPTPKAGMAALSKWEKTAWQAAHLIAINEQLTFWQKVLAAQQLPTAEEAANAIAHIDRLQRTREQIIEQVKRGNDESAAIASLQEAVDVVVDNCLLRIPPEARRWKIGEDTRFYDPTNTPYRMFGPFFMRAIYSPYSGMDKLWRQWDIRYLAALGFNGIRIPVQWNRLEPERGVFDPNFLKIQKDIIAEAERYGLGITFDLHWPYPDWFRKGEPGLQPDPKDIDTENSYHWPDALVESWGRIVSAFAEHPNIVAFEVPTNETPIAKGPKGVLAYPMLMKLWNEWLKQTYGSREALAEVWGSADERYALKDSENWDDYSIQPLGFQNDISAGDAYLTNPRLWDHLRWTAWMQADVSTRIMEAIRAELPDSIGIFQRTIGDVWDKSPVPLDYNSIQTVVGENVWPGTHYGMGGLAAYKARAFSTGTYDSEQQMENGEAQVIRHIKLGMGFSPFSFHARGGGGMFFRDDSWLLKSQVDFLPRQAQWIRTYWPEQPEDIDVRVAIIENTRLAATTKRGVLRRVLDTVLKQPRTHVDVFEGLRIARDPHLLDGYDIVITESDYMDPELLDLLDTQFEGQVLLFGGMERDALARTDSHSPAADLARRGHLFAPAVGNGGLQSAQEEVGIGKIDLTGTWQWSFIEKPEADKQNRVPAWSPSLLDSLKWTTIQVPGLWGEKELLGTREFMIGDAWYRKSVVIPADWEGRSLLLDIGAIDDIDWVFFNGRQIGHTGTSTPEYWLARRQYVILPSMIKWGEPNEIVILVRNLRDDGGIYNAPVQIRGSETWSLSELPGGTPKDSAAPTTGALVRPNSLHPEATVVATFRGSTGEEVPALVTHGRWVWWTADLAIASTPETNEQLIKWAVQSAK